MEKHVSVLLSQTYVFCKCLSKYMDFEVDIIGVRMEREVVASSVYTSIVLTIVWELQIKP